MKKIFIYLLLAVLIVSSVKAVPVDVGAIREEGYDSECAAQVEESRLFIEQFGEDTDQRFQYHKEAVIKEIEQEMRLFKFTVFIIIFFASFLAYRVNDIIRRRIDKKYEAISKSRAKKAQSTAGVKSSKATL